MLLREPRTCENEKTLGTSLRVFNLVFNDRGCGVQRF